jgi:hypothetical protein
MEDDFDELDEFDDFDDDDDEDINEQLNAYRKLPLYQKAESIANLTKIIVETIDDEKDLFQIKEQMLLNGYILGPKIAGAEGTLYSLRMENAMLIRIHARELMAQTSLCKREKLCSPEYLQILRDELEELRKMFIEWVKSFDKTDDIKDEWDILF